MAKKPLTIQFLGLLLLVGHWASQASPPSRRFDAFDYPPEITDAPPENFFWTGKTGKWMVHWKPLWIGAVSDSGERVVIHDGLDWKEQRSPEPGCWQERHVRLLSVMGDYVSYEMKQVEGCGAATAKPEERRSWHVIDLRRPQAVQSLALLFPPAEIRTALLAQPLVRESLAHTSPPTKAPRDLAGLISGLGRMTLIYDAGSGECYVSLERVLSAFAIEDQAKDKTRVRLTVEPEGKAACREKPVELVLDLKTPKGLATAVKRAAEKKAGFLLKDVSNVAPTSETISRRETPIEEVPTPE